MPCFRTRATCVTSFAPADWTRNGVGQGGCNTQRSKHTNTRAHTSHKSCERGGLLCTLRSLSLSLRTTKVCTSSRTEVTSSRAVVSAGRQWGGCYNPPCYECRGQITWSEGGAIVHRRANANACYGVQAAHCQMQAHKASRQRRCQCACRQTW